MNEKRILGNDLLLAEVCSLLSQGRRVRLRVKGDSMVPFIRNGDIITLRPSGELHKGEVVLARVPEGYVVHRITGISGESVTLMGDANLYGKERCLRDMVYGTVESVVRDNRETMTPHGRRWTSCRVKLLPLRRLLHRIRKLRND